MVSSRCRETLAGPKSHGAPGVTRSPPAELPRPVPALPGSTRTHHPVPLKCPSNLLLLSLALSPLSQRGKDLGHCELLLERFPKLAPLFEIKEERGPSLFSPFTHRNYSISSLSAIHWLSARPLQPGHRSARRTSLCFPEKD